MTCAHFGRDQICTQAKASFSPFGHPSQVNASWVTSISLSLANEIQEMSALKWVYLWPACTCEETCLSVWPPNASPFASSTSRYLRLLASPFGHGFRTQRLIFQSADVTVERRMGKYIFFWARDRNALLTDSFCRLLLRCAEGGLLSDSEVQKAALHVICNCVCGPRMRVSLYIVYQSLYIAFAAAP